MVSLTLENVWKSFGGTLVLKGISFTASEGTLTVLLGPSGCGKTTTLKIIAGLLKPDRGRVLFDGRDVTNVPARKRNVGMVFQNLALFPHLTVWENIAYGLKARGWSEQEIRKRVNELLEVLKLKGLENRYPRQLSGGQQQRVALARALAPQPELLLLDEPLTNLDANLREELRWEIKKLQEQLKITTIYVTHDQAEALQLADKVVIMREGEVVQKGDPVEVFEHPANAFVASFLGYNILRIKPEPEGEFYVYRFDYGYIKRHVKGVLAVKPEDIVVAAEPKPPALEGEVVTCSFAKTSYRVKVSTRVGEVEAYAKKPVRGRVYLCFDPSKILVLPS